MAKTNPIDPNVPAGSEVPRLGDNRIRNLAAAVAEEQNVDHYMGSDGGAGTGYNEDAAGEHKKVTLRVQTSKPTAASGKGFVYTKTVNGVVELFYEDHAGSEIQITSGGILKSLNLTDDQTADGVKTFSKQAVFTLGLTTAKALISTLATGTPPLTVDSTTKVDNLNVDKVDGKDIDSIFGAWAGKSNNTSYLAASDGFVVGYGSRVTDQYCYTDSSNPPTSIKFANDAENGYGGGGFMFPVIKGNYWKVTGATAVFWLPIGA